MEAFAGAEWEKLRSVALHRPSFETFFGIMTPKAELYERPFDREKALKEHDAFSSALKDSGVRVYMLHEAIKSNSSKSSVRRNLEKLAISSVIYSGKGSAAYKKQLLDYISGYSAEDLLLMAELHPEARLSGNRLDFVVREPLANLYFMRDQQVTSPNGLFLGNMSKARRRSETKITSLLFDSLGIKYVRPDYNGSTLEGGDFMPAGKFALIGVGDRTSVKGAMSLIGKMDGFEEIAIVEQPRHPLMLNGFDPMLDMHLDTYFNIAGDGIAVGQTDLLKLARTTVYVKHGIGYEATKERTNLYEYITSKGFDLIGLSMLEQASFGSNFLCVRDRHILAIDCSTTAKSVVRAFKSLSDSRKEYYSIYAELKREYSKKRYMFPDNREMNEHDIDAVKLGFSNLTGGYGGAHCMSCVIRRG
jgi:arginine deiminase